MMMRAAFVAATMMIGTAEAGAVVHVPPADVVAGTPLELVAEAAPATPTLTLHYRVTGGPAAFQTLELVRRGEAQWVAVVPAAAVVSPGIDYYIAAGGTAVFASETWPHMMPVVATVSTERRARDIIRAKARRSQIHTSFEWIDYGHRGSVAGAAIVVAIRMMVWWCQRVGFFIAELCRVVLLVARQR